MGRRGNESPCKFGVGTLMQIVPPRFCHVSKFQAPLLPLQCNKKLINPITLTPCSLLLKSTSSNVHRVTTSCTKFNTFSDKGTDKNAAQNSPKHAISSEKFNIFLGRGYPSSPNQAFASPEVQPHFTPLTLATGINVRP